MDETRLIEFAPEWAAAVADMWNESSEGWNGERFNKTRDNVVEQERTNGSIHTFLIVEGERVLGYCNLHRDHGEPDALYIGMLNVRPEMHGRKLGKRLVLHALQRTCELGYSRLYLHTWAGNTKATPLYKKTGFFWMDLDQSTHLVNFMPMVLRDELLAPQLAGMDWYADSAREIEVKPDGVKRDRFEIYTYSWEKDGHRLEVDFTRRGRGMSRIETDDWSVELRAPNRRLVFGRTFEATLIVRSKNGQPVDVRIEGRDDGPVRFDWKDGGEVRDEQTFTGAFRIDPIERRVSEGDVHPGLTAKVTVNGLSTTFKLGLSPSFPAWASLITTQKLHAPGREHQAWLAMSNQGLTDVTLWVKLQDTDDVQFVTHEVERRLVPKEPCDMPVRFTVHRPCLYNVSLDATARFEDSGEEVDFKLPVIMELSSWTGSFHGVTNYCHVLAQGPYMVYFMRVNQINDLVYRDVRIESHDGNICIMSPQIGPPYQSEFCHEEVKDVLTYREDEALCLRAVFRSPRWPKAPLVMTAKLYPSGLFERVYELNNEGDEPVDLGVMSSLWCRSRTKVLPTPEGLVCSARDINDEDGAWDYTRLTEPWMWSEDEGMNRAMIWDLDEPIRKTSWDFVFNYAPGELKPGESWRSKPVTFAINVFNSWRDVRSYALGRDEPAPLPVSACDFTVETPFVSDQVRARARLMSLEEISGAWTVCGEDGVVTGQTKKLGEKGGGVDFTFAVERPFTVARLRARLDDSVWRAERDVALYGVRGEIRSGVEEQEGQQVWWADNGVIRIAAAPEFSPGLFTLRFGGHEWFDNSFPEPVARAWWKPWVGGVCTRPSRMSLHRIMFEKRTARHVALRDTAGVEWRGLRVDVEVNEHEPSKGLAWRQYFLMAPGAPALMLVTFVDQRTGLYLPGMQVQTELFVNPKDGCSVVMSDGHGHASRIAPGYRQQSVYTPELLTFICDDGPTMAHLPAHGVFNREVFCTSEVLTVFGVQQRSIENGQGAQIAPEWLLFPDKQLRESELDALHRVTLQWDTETEIE